MIILTPNRRLAAFSAQQYNLQQYANGHKVWTSADIYSIEIWLQQLWQLCLDTNLPVYKPILNIKQQQIIFEQIIRSSDSPIELLRINATAQNAIQAWKFLRQWQIDLSRVAVYADYTPDVMEFYKWCQAYLAWLQAHNYTDFYLMVDALIDALPAIAHSLPHKICLRGFNEQTPQYASLFAKLATLGLEIVTDHLTQDGAAVVRTGFASVHDEFLAAAQWASAQVELDPKQTIGVVIPDLQQQRSQVQDAFAQHCQQQIVNISAPLPLANYSSIATALQICTLAKSSVNYSEFSTLIRSPHIKDYHREKHARAILDRRLRDRVEATVNWQILLAHIQEECPCLQICMREFQDQIAELNGKHTTNYWLDKIQGLLKVWGWPGSKLGECADAKWNLLAIQEADLMSCWHAVLEEYHSLNLVLHAHTFGEAINIIRRLAHDTPFLPSETGLTKIHVLGMLEAEGLIFDKLWVCGMSRDTWPPAANPNPFIPLELQRQFDLPHCSPQRELAMAKKYTANLQCGARQQVIFSYPEYIDEQKVAPSNLIVHLPMQQFALQTLHKDINSTLEYLHDNYTTSYPEQYVRGGATSLRLQAQCPFKANAEIRLKALALQQPQNILNPAQRGTIVHEILESFWRITQNHAQMVLYTAEQLEQIVDRCVQETLSAWQRKLPFTLTTNYIMLEAHRLHNLMLRWLEHEKQRSPFAVYALEQESLISVGPLQIKMKLDRIDQVEHGYVIIDYKTGMVHINQWFSDPIYEPQLPIYATSTPKDIIAVVYAIVRAQETKFTGVATEDGLLPSVKSVDAWSEMFADWQQKLNNTAQEFVAGNAQVTPYSPLVCATCKLQAFCRIYEQ